MEPEPRCPFFKKIVDDRCYPLSGYCSAPLAGGLEVPTIAEFRDFCTTERYVECQIYLARVRENAGV